MSGQYRFGQEPAQSPFNRQAPQNNQNVSYKTNINRMKTKKWVEAKKNAYDGDDWGDYDEYDEYGVDVPPPVPAKPYSQPSRSFTDPTRQPVPQLGRRSSFETGDEHRSFSAAMPPPLSQDYAQQPQAAPHRHVSAASDFSDTPQHRRDFEPSALPQPLHTKVSPTQGSFGSPPATSPRGRAPSNPDKPLPLIRPADIYKRVEEERQRERASLDSQRPSLDSLSARPKEEDAEGGRPLQPLETVAERKSEYLPDLDVTKQNQGKQPVAQDASHPQSLPQLQGISAFDNDFWSSGQQSQGPTNAAPAVSQSDDQGFRSVVDQAFTRTDDQHSVPPTPISKDEDSIVSRSNTGSTSGISPIMSRVPSSATSALKNRNLAGTDGSTPVIAEETSEMNTPVSRPTSMVVPGGSQPIVARKPSPAHSRNVSSTSLPRSGLATPSRGESPARSPALAPQRNLPEPESAQLTSANPLSPASESDYTTREADIAAAMKLSLEKDAPELRSAEKESQDAFLESHKAQSPISDAVPRSRSQSPSKNRVQALAGKFGDVSHSRRGSTQSNTSVQSWEKSQSNSRAPSPTKGLTSNKPLLKTEDSFRPKLPGQWESYATTAATPSEQGDKEKELGADKEPIKTIPGIASPLDEVDLTPTTSKHPVSATEPSKPLPFAKSTPDSEDAPSPPPKDSALEPTSPTSPQDGGIPQLSTDLSADDQESDRLRKEIVASLTPVQSEKPITEAGHDSLRAASPSGTNRASSILPSEYDSYWEESPSQGSAAQPLTQAPAVGQPSTADASDASKLGLLNRFSWEDRNPTLVPVEEKARADPATQEPKSQVSQEPKSIQEVKATTPVLERAVQDESKKSFDIPEPYFGPTHTPAIAEPVKEPEVSDRAPTPTQDAVKLASPTLSEIDREPTPVSGLHVVNSALNPEAVDLPPRLSAEASSESKQPADSHEEPLVPQKSKEQDPAQPLASPSATQEPVPQSPTAQSPTSDKPLGFRDIVTLKSSSDRIDKYNQTRDYWANADHGLGTWISSVIETNPDLATQAYPQVRPELAHSATTKHKHTGSIPIFGQHHSASNQTPTTPTSSANASPFGSHSARIASHQMQAKGKDLLHTAGVLGGKGMTGAKGLFAKGKSRFGREKASRTDSAPSSREASEEPELATTPEQHVTRQSIDMDSPRDERKRRRFSLTSPFHRSTRSRSRPSSVIISSTRSTPRDTTPAGGSRRHSYHAPDAWNIIPSIEQTGGTSNHAEEPARLGVLPSPAKSAFGMPHDRNEDAPALPHVLNSVEEGDGGWQGQSQGNASHQMLQSVIRYSTPPAGEPSQLQASPIFDEPPAIADATDATRAPSLGASSLRDTKLENVEELDELESPKKLVQETLGSNEAKAEDRTMQGTDKMTQIPENHVHEKLKNPQSEAELKRNDVERSEGEQEEEEEEELEEPPFLLPRTTYSPMPAQVRPPPPEYLESDDEDPSTQSTQDPTPPPTTDKDLKGPAQIPPEADDYSDDDRPPVLNHDPIPPRPLHDVSDLEDDGPLPKPKQVPIPPQPLQHEVSDEESFRILRNQKSLKRKALKKGTESSEGKPKGLTLEILPQTTYSPVPTPQANQVPVPPIPQDKETETPMDPITPSVAGEISPVVSSVGVGLADSDDEDDMPPRLNNEVYLQRPQQDIGAVSPLFPPTRVEIEEEGRDNLTTPVASPTTTRDEKRPAFETETIGAGDVSPISMRPNNGDGETTPTEMAAGRKTELPETRASGRDEGANDASTSTAATPSPDAKPQRVSASKYQVVHAVQLQYVPSHSPRSSLGSWDHDSLDTFSGTERDDNRTPEIPQVVDFSSSKAGKAGKARETRPDSPSKMGRIHTPASSRGQSPSKSARQPTQELSVEDPRQPGIHGRSKSLLSMISSAVSDGASISPVSSHAGRSTPSSGTRAQPMSSKKSPISPAQITGDVTETPHTITSPKDEDFDLYADHDGFVKDVRDESGQPLRVSTDDSPQSAHSPPTTGPKPRAELAKANEAPKDAKKDEEEEPPRYSTDRPMSFVWGTRDADGNVQDQINLPAETIVDATPRAVNVPNQFGQTPAPPTINVNVASPSQGPGEAPNQLPGQLTGHVNGGQEHHDTSSAPTSISPPNSDHQQFATPVVTPQVTPANSQRQHFVTPPQSEGQQFVSPAQSERQNFVSPPNSDRQQFVSPPNSDRLQFASPVNSDLHHVVSPPISVRQPFISANSDRQNVVSPPPSEHPSAVSPLPSTRPNVVSPPLSDRQIFSTPPTSPPLPGAGSPRPAPTPPPKLADRPLLNDPRSQQNSQFQGMNGQDTRMRGALPIQTLGPDMDPRNASKVHAQQPRNEYEYQQQMMALQSKYPRFGANNNDQPVLSSSKPAKQEKSSGRPKLSAMFKGFGGSSSSNAQQQSAPSVPTMVPGPNAQPGDRSRRSSYQSGVSNMLSEHTGGGRRLGTPQGSIRPVSPAAESFLSQDSTKAQATESRLDLRVPANPPPFGGIPPLHPPPGAPAPPRAGTGGHLEPPDQGGKKKRFSSLGALFNRAGTTGTAVPVKPKMSKEEKKAMKAQKHNTAPLPGLQWSPGQPQQYGMQQGPRPFPGMQPVAQQFVPQQTTSPQSISSHGSFPPQGVPMTGLPRQYTQPGFAAGYPPQQPGQAPRPEPSAYMNTRQMAQEHETRRSTSSSHPRQAPAGPEFTTEQNVHRPDQPDHWPPAGGYYKPPTSKHEEAMQEARQASSAGSIPPPAMQAPVHYQQAPPQVPPQYPQPPQQPLPQVQQPEQLQQQQLQLQQMQQLQQQHLEQQRLQQQQLQQRQLQQQQAQAPANLGRQQQVNSRRVSSPVVAAKESRLGQLAKSKQRRISSPVEPRYETPQIPAAYNHVQGAFTSPTDQPAPQFPPPNTQPSHPSPPQYGRQYSADSQMQPISPQVSAPTQMPPTQRRQSSTSSATSVGVSPIQGPSPPPATQRPPQNRMSSITEASQHERPWDLNVREGATEQEIVRARHQQYMQQQLAAQQQRYEAERAGRSPSPRTPNFTQSPPPQQHYQPPHQPHLHPPQQPPSQLHPQHPHQHVHQHQFQHQQPPHLPQPPPQQQPQQIITQQPSQSVQEQSEPQSAGGFREVLPKSSPQPFAVEQSLQQPSQPQDGRKSPASVHSNQPAQPAPIHPGQAPTPTPASLPLPMSPDPAGVRSPVNPIASTLPAPPPLPKIPNSPRRPEVSQPRSPPPASQPPTEYQLHQQAQQQAQQQQEQHPQQYQPEYEQQPQPDQPPPPHEDQYRPEYDQQQIPDEPPPSYDGPGIANDGMDKERERPRPPNIITQPEDRGRQTEARQRQASIGILQHPQPASMAASPQRSSADMGADALRRQIFAQQEQERQDRINRAQAQRADEERERQEREVARARARELERSVSGGGRVGSIRSVTGSARSNNASGWERRGSTTRPVFELPAVEDDEPVMRATSFPGQEWVPPMWTDD